MDSLLDKTEPRTLALALIGAALLIVAALVSYVLWPQLEQYRENTASQALLAQAAPGDSGLAVQLEAVRNEVSALSRTLHGDMAGLPAKQMESFIIGRLQKISWDHGVRLVSVRPGVGDKIQDFQERLFELHLQARYHDFYHWLNAIGKHLGFIVVQKYHIRPRDQEGQNPELDIRLTIVSYHLVQEAS